MWIISYRVSIISLLKEYELNKLTSFPMGGFIAQLVQRRIGGFAKSRPAAQRPTACGPPRPATARGLRRPGGPEAQSWFSTVFCPVVNPRSCRDLHRVWVCKMEVRSSCMIPWSVLSVERLSLALIFCPRHPSLVLGTDLPSQALIFCPLHWSQSLVLIFCP